MSSHIKDPLSHFLSLSVVHSVVEFECRAGEKSAAPRSLEPAETGRETARDKMKEIWKQEENEI